MKRAIYLRKMCRLSIFISSKHTFVLMFFLLCAQIGNLKCFDIEWRFRNPLIVFLGAETGIGPNPFQHCSADVAMPKGHALHPLLGDSHGALLKIREHCIALWLHWR